MFNYVLKKTTAVLLTLAIFIFLTLPARPVSAAVKGFVVKDNSDGKYYEYPYQELLGSYVYFVMGKDAKLYSHYSTKPMQAFYDDKKGYVDYADVLKAYTTSVVTNQPFDLNIYTESNKAKAIQLPASLSVVSVLEGKLVFTVKSVDPVLNALEELNKASDAAGITASLTNKASILGLDLTNYLALNGYGQNYVASQILLSRPAAGYKTLVEVQTIFTQKTAESKTQLQNALNEINSAATTDILAAALNKNAAALELQIAILNNLPADIKLLALQKVLAKKPYSTIIELSIYFNDSIIYTGKNVYVSFVNYSRTLNEVMDIQMGLNPPPQTDLYGGGWQTALRGDAQYYVDPRNFFTSEVPQVKAGFITIEVSADSYLRVRQEPSISGVELTRVYRDETYQILDTSDDGSVIWYKIQARGFTGWVYGGYVRLSAQVYTREMLQFLNLSSSANVRVEDMAKILVGKGILDGKANAFIQGSATNAINEIFLVSLALHETGYGTSLLSTGIDFPDVDNLFGGGTVKVYNMFGIGAYDSNPNYYGAQWAYQQRWFSPEAAIIGGAKFAGSNYINNPNYQQNTLYKMRWNPASPGTHQYATDMGWAVKQTTGIKELYDQLSTYTMRFEVPRYK